MSERVVLETRGLNWATEKNRVEAVLGRRQCVVHVDANPVSQTATVTFYLAQTAIAELRGWLEECGYHHAGHPVPSSHYDPMD